MHNEKPFSQENKNDLIKFMITVKDEPSEKLVQANSYKAFYFIPIFLTLNIAIYINYYLKYIHHSNFMDDPSYYLSLYFSSGPFYNTLAGSLIILNLIIPTILHIINVLCLKNFFSNKYNIAVKTFKNYNKFNTINITDNEIIYNCDNKQLKFIIHSIQKSYSIDDSIIFFTNYYLLNNKKKNKISLSIIPKSMFKSKHECDNFLKKIKAT